MNPVQAFTNTFNGVETISQSQFTTFSFAITQEFEAYVMLEVQTPTDISASPEIEIYRSVDGGSTWETDGVFKGAFPAVGASTHKKTINLETGQYLIKILSGGGSSATWTISNQTAYVITAYE